MKKTLKLLSILLIITIFFSSKLNLNTLKTYADSPSKSITILFTHDLHDNLYPFESTVDGETSKIGGYSRLSSEIKNQKKKDPEALVVDAGDFSMGTLFQTIFASEAPGLRLMGQMGYDVTTLGNHEFDFRPEGLANSLNAAKDSGDNLPQIVASNTIFPNNDESLTTPLEKLKNSMEHYGVEDYTLIDRNGSKIGIFGLMGSEADSNAPMAEVEFPDAIEESKRVVKILKEKENVDLIVSLSHSGTSGKKADSEDEILAEKVPEIDVIISGHSHTKISEPTVIGDTLVVSSGQYGENLGVLNILQTKNGRWELNDYELAPIDDSIPGDSEIDTTIGNFRDLVQKEYLDNFNMEFDDVLAYSPFNFTPFSQLGLEHSEDILGNLISDSYIYAVKESEGEDYEPISASISPVGVIRDSFVKGDITVSEVFNVSSLGIGPDEVSGYPLLSVYLTGKELKTTAEVDASITPLMSVVQLYMSGLNFEFNPNRLIFDKVTDLNLIDTNGNPEEIKDDELYRIVAGLYSAQMLSVVGDQSMGILSVVPKDKDGNTITDFEKHIIYDDGHELKEWLAIAEYLKSFEKEDGVPQLPLYYEKTQGRKIVNRDKNIFNRIKNPNKIWMIFYSIIAVVLAGISYIIVFLIRLKNRKKKK